MNKKRTIGLAFTYVGTVVGAGFSSGREIWRFFSRHDSSGIYAIVITAFFFVILAPLFFRLGKERGIQNYQDFFYKYLPYPLTYIFDIIFSCFLLGSVSVMLAGSGTVFFNLLGLPYYVGVAITVFFILLTLTLNRKGILTVNSILIPVLIIITIYTVLSFISIDTIQLQVQKSQTSNLTIWARDSLFYGSYNLVMAIAVMTGIFFKEDKQDILAAGLIGGLILIVLLFIIFTGLNRAFTGVPKEEIPLLYIAAQVGRGVYLLYIIALYFAMLTTAIANYFAFVQRFTSLVKIKYEPGLLLGLIFVLPLVPSGFSYLVDRLYPFFGCLSIIIIIFYIVLIIDGRK